MAPRGMLQEGALAGKSFKKKVFLFIFKKLRVPNGIVWHATDQQEREDVGNIFGINSQIRVAANIPKPPVAISSVRTKRPGELKMIYLSLIAEKKSLLLILESLRHVKIPIQFDIYGPIKDEAYWHKCELLFSGQIHQIQYKGIANPTNVQTLLSTYHLFVLPTKGENFGHAIYEALSVGTPVLISRYTPWGALQELEAGYTVESDNVQDWVSAIEYFIRINNDQFVLMSKKATKLALQYFLKNDFKSAYLDLFS